MKHTDDKIREIFSNKLHDFESEVPQGLWENVSAGLSNTGAATVAQTGIKALISKVLLIGGVAATVVGSIVYTVMKEEPKAPVKTEQQSVPLENRGIEEKQTRVEESSSLNQEIAQTPVSAIDSKEEQSTKYYPTQSEDKSDNREISGIHPNEAEHYLNNQSDGSANSNDNNPDVEDRLPTQNTSVTPLQALSAEFNTAAADKTQRIYFFMPVVADAANYHWNFGDGEESDEKSPLHQYQEDDKFEVTLMISDANGNQLAQKKTIEVQRPGVLVVPNIFTPNGDGINDTFDIKQDSQGVEFGHIVIRDNQGKEIFESDGSRLWDGNDKNGTPCQAGTYYYYISGQDRNRDSFEKRGTVRLDR